MVCMKKMHYGNPDKIIYDEDEYFTMTMKEMKKDKNMYNEYKMSLILTKDRHNLTKTEHGYAILHKKILCQEGGRVTEEYTTEEAYGLGLDEETKAKAKKD